MRTDTYKLTLKATVLLAIATQALADPERQISPAEFDRMTVGRVLVFDQGGAEYGIEQYMRNRQVIWQYADGTCSTGHWFASDQNICFTYENTPPQCWVFVERDGDFFARTLGVAAGDPSELRMASEMDGPLDCPAANLGV